MVSFTSTFVALFVAAATLQNVQASQVGTVIKGVFKDVTGLKVRGETDVWTRGETDGSLKSEFASCMNTLHQSARPKMVWTSESDLEISGLPSSCISEINKYNTLPNIAAMNAAQGTAQVLNSTSVHLSGLTPSFVKFMKDE